MNGRNTSLIIGLEMVNIKSLKVPNTIGSENVTNLQKLSFK